MGHAIGDRYWNTARNSTKRVQYAQATKSLSTLSQKSATVAEFRRCLAVFGDSRIFLRQCGQGLMKFWVWRAPPFSIGER